MAKPRDAAKERYWRGIIRRWEASGLGAGQFCDREGVPEHRLRWWRQTLRRRDQGQARPPRGVRRASPSPVRADQPGGSAFLPIDLAVSIGGPIEVIHPRGHVIRVPAIFDAKALERILAAIDAPANSSGEP
jgi:hypothetical protein